PHFHEEEYINILKQQIQKEQALILKDGETAIGVMLFSRGSGCIEFMATHPLYRQKGIPKALLEKVMGEFVCGKEISTTTYRAGDKADTGHRKQLLALGFAEAELLTEFGYPTQRFVLPNPPL
ncbi:MAG: GNAT family N-acetyltransferase, partial [Clostridiales bacterium]|nr:GNAT family N-acetyltransferase [Clostridiales bacterium]